MTNLTPGDIVWMSPDGAVGREQRGRRPAVVVVASEFLTLVDSLALVVPVTSRDRGWPNHIPLRGLPGPSWAMTEQLRVISRERLHDIVGVAGDDEMQRIRYWLKRFLDL
ncbi:type II toxin-antitoxin system PemK/MazF family toxin [Microbacterium sp. KUDC0406]|uniref:type II toxin-antitoxin system PemK/MazF family toxin n=1 Tax=Microbacterium sp. KUDC0406 TaxID=2909588 RepID=UPI001F3A447F|nr:type II toxin-antitoxin system PemK/MazF family toxin [Microbacterium sp. KUDC0406]UJP08715.1 type II toxin-antitoxin system PemK/MazF family toxin [Microbacterium sp. KUDC0406]